LETFAETLDSAMIEEFRRIDPRPVKRDLD